MTQISPVDTRRISGTGDATAYHSPMEGNMPSLERPPWASDTRSRRSLPISVLIAAVVVSAAVIGAAMIARGGSQATLSSHSLTPGAAGATTPATSATCKSWSSIRGALDAIPGLPDGWNWDTPNIDVLIANRNAAMTKALDRFESSISTTDPASVTTPAREYIAERRKEMRQDTDHTYTTADGVLGNIALANLDRVCRGG